MAATAVAGCGAVPRSRPHWGLLRRPPDLRLSLPHPPLDHDVALVRPATSHALLVLEVQPHTVDGEAPVTPRHVPQGLAVEGVPGYRAQLVRDQFVEAARQPSVKASTEPCPRWPRASPTTSGLRIM